MLRRTSTRAIPEFNFGHPALTKAYLGQSNYKAPPLVATDAKITTCANGARIITHDLGGANTSIGTYVEAGAKFDPAAAPGLSYVFRWALTTSNMDNSLFQIDRGVRSVGAALEHLEVNKKYTGMRVDARGDMWQNPTTNLFTCVSAPRFHEADIERFRDTMDAQLEEQRWQQPRDYCVDQLETIAFHKETLGNPRRVPVTANDACSSKRLLDHWAKHATPDRVIISGVNVDHQALVKAYEDAPFPHSSSAPHHSRSDKNFADQTNEATTYQGGNENHEQENRAKEIGQKPDCEAETIAAIGYKTFGRDVSVKDYAAALVAQQAMNLIVKDAIRYEREDTHHGIRTFYRPYSSAGLLGFTVRADPAGINKNILDGLTILKEIGTANLDAAKAGAAVAFHNENIDTVRDYCNFLGTSFLKGEQRLKPEDIFAAISSVSAADIKRVQDFAKEARPTMWVTGETFGVPSLRKMGY
eukprot:GILI01005991.1.p1 GENE.GILI01005991.1~~GILI01005991.1.p1  ORF type:complete len:472 (+),score=172.46 GILI01005991.1:64-1479(+)